MPEFKEVKLSDDIDIEQLRNRNFAKEVEPITPQCNSFSLMPVCNSCASFVDNKCTNPIMQQSYLKDYQPRLEYTACIKKKTFRKQYRLAYCDLWSKI